MAIQGFDDARATRVLTLNWGFDSQIQILGGSLKYIKWICSGKEKLRSTRCKCFQIYSMQLKRVISYILIKHCANFYKKPVQFTTSKAQKTPILGLFQGGYRFFAILTHKTQSNHLKTILNRFYGQKQAQKTISHGPSIQSRKDLEGTLLY